MTQYISMRGNKLEVARFGRPHADRPTLVFLHEGLGCVALWKDFPEKLAQLSGCEAFVFSRLGYGNSDPCALPRPIDFMHTEALEVLPALLEAAAIERCILIGHSDGGSIALIYAGGTPAEALCGIITEAAHVFVEPLTIRSIAAAKVKYETEDLKQRLERYHGPNTECAFRGWNDVWLHPDFVRWNIESFLQSVPVPILAIQGQDDPYGTPAQVEAIVRQAGGPAAPLMLPQCGHAPHRDREAAVLEAMNAFIQGLS